MIPLLIVSCLDLQANDASFFRAPDDFFQRIRPLRPFQYAGVPDSSAINKTCSKYYLFHDPAAGWMLVGSGSGQVWTLDSARQWVRQDSTEVFGYHFSALILPGPRKYGGNGLWRSNGLLITYSWSAHEWESTLLSREIHSDGTYDCFYSADDSALYQMGVHFSNAALKQQDYHTDSLYRLDLRTGDWDVLGKFSQSFLECYNSRGFTWPSNDGLLIRLNRSHDAVYVDFKKSTYRILAEDVVVRLWSFDRTQYLQNRISISTAYGIYSINPSTYELLDSLSWEQILASAGPESPLMESAAGTTDSNNILLISICGVAAIFGWWQWRKRNRRHISEFLDQPVLEVVDDEKHPGASFLLEKSDGSWYVGGRPITGITNAESRLLEVLVEKRSMLQPLSTQSMNEILGIDQRTIDSQKKIRSEVVRHINRCFQDAGYRGEAVQRSRQEDDRRAVTYVIAPDIQTDKS